MHEYHKLRIEDAMLAVAVGVCRYGSPMRMLDEITKVYINSLCTPTRGTEANALFVGVSGINSKGREKIKRKTQGTFAQN